MGLKISSPSLSKKEQQIGLEIEDWIKLRNNTIKELLRVANELDDLHKKAAYSKIAGGLAGLVGGGLVVGGLAFSFFTGGTSLFLTGTGVTLAAGGGVTATIAEVVEHLKKKTRVDAAQKALEADKAAQATLLSNIETTIETSDDIGPDEKSRVKSSLKSFVDSIQKVWVSGFKM